MVESKGCGIWRRSGAARCDFRLLLDTPSPIVAVLQHDSLTASASSHPPQNTLFVQYSFLQVEQKSYGEVSKT